MNTIAKKTLSLVFAGTMALTSLTVGSVSALAAGASDYKAVTEGVTTVDSTKVAFTPATTAYYNISFAKSVNNKSASSNYDIANYLDSGYNEDNFSGHASSTRFSIESVNTTPDSEGLVYGVNNEDVYTPAQNTYKLIAGDTYYLNLSDASSAASATVSTLTIAKSEYAFDYTSINEKVTYVWYYSTNKEPNYTTRYLTTGIGAKITKYLGTATTVAVPAKINGYAVKAVELNANRELAKRITVPVTIDFMCVSSYGASTVSSGKITIKKDLEESIEGRNVIVIEDIIDTGRTLRYLLDDLSTRGPKSLKLCAMLDKPDRRITDVAVDYTGFEIPDEFVVGYGLDYDQRYRNLPYIGILDLG